MAEIYRLDSQGRPFQFPTMELDKQEYARIVSEINTCYTLYDGQMFCVHDSYDINDGAYSYYFENHGYNEYNIVSKQMF